MELLALKDYDVSIDFLIYRVLTNDQARKN
jgi:hypothetical protein